MITAKCPDCLSVGIKRGWQPVSKRDEEYTFVCSNLRCPRAREPWSVIMSRKQSRPSRIEGFGLLEAWLAGVFAGLLLDAGRRLMRPPRRWLGRIARKSKFKDPRYARINGRWVKVDDHQEMTGQLEDLQEGLR